MVRFIPHRDERYFSLIFYVQQDEDVYNERDRIKKISADDTRGQAVVLKDLTKVKKVFFFFFFED